MQIGHNGLGQYDKYMQDGKIQERPVVDAANRQASSESQALKEGAVFKGEILEIAGDKVTISLENQAKLLARLQQGVDLGVGDRLLFSVKENTGSQILIKPMFDSLQSAQTQVLERALDAAGLSPTEKNFTAAKELMDAGLPVDKGNLVKLLSQSMKFEGTSMQTLTALNKMNIPVNEANIAQYERYQSATHQLINDMSQTADSMASFTQMLPASTDGSTLLSFAQDMLTLFHGEASGTEMTQTSPEGEPLPQTVGGEASQGANELQNHTDIKNLPQQLSTEFSVAQQGGEASSASTLVNTDGTVPQEMGVQSAELIATGEETTQEATPLSKQNLEAVGLKVGLQGEEVQQLAKELSNAGIPRGDVNQMLTKADNGADLLQKIVNQLQSMDMDSSQVRQVLDNGEFRKILANVIKDNWMLNPKEMKDPKEIDELYDKVLKQGKEFESMVQAKGGDTSNFQDNFQQTRQNMQFMEHLNQQMIYAQMPLKLSNQNANSELYVYADKRKLMEKKDGISVLLHLDMDHLGQTDVKVTLTGTNVNARFYLNDQESVDILVNNMDELADALKERGFSLTNEVVKRQPAESVNQVIDEVIDENAERSIKRYTFDMRT